MEGRNGEGHSKEIWFAVERAAIRGSNCGGFTAEGFRIGSATTLVPSGNRSNSRPQRLKQKVVNVVFAFRSSLAFGEHGLILEDSKFWLSSGLEMGTVVMCLEVRQPIFFLNML
ncbi:hypothetical protein L484_002843 [Morus notabilis]|uniref:Uncharacterized protein n=1 Tax=Morus notabilis TaxID=981085 RepID=W9RPM6_9ROSA|nr:hypothetical protein L484_002843 [Morus notabilis]